MSLLKILFWATTWLAAWLLFAKKSWTEFRKDLEWKTSEEKAKIFWEEILWMWKEVLWELKKLPENDQVKKLKTLWKEKIENLIEEVKKNWKEVAEQKFWELKEFWWNKLDELLPKLEKTLDEIKKHWPKKFDELKNSVQKKVWEKILNKKKPENLWSKMTKIFKK